MTSPTSIIPGWPSSRRAAIRALRLAPIYPSSSPNVIAVGGHTLTAAARTARGYTETAWSGGGSGCSAYEAMPAWQAAVPNAVTACRTRRAVADVSADANPATGVAVYDSFGYPGCIRARSVVRASPHRSSAGSTDSPATRRSPRPTVLRVSHAAASYTLPNLFDITSGGNGTCSIALACTASTGWDGPTGLGSPDGIAGFDRRRAAADAANPDRRRRERSQ